MDEEPNLAPKAASEKADASAAERRDLVPVNQGGTLQTVPSVGKTGRRHWLKIALALAVVIGGAGGGAGDSGRGDIDEIALAAGGQHGKQQQAGETGQVAAQGGWTTI